MNWKTWLIGLQGAVIGAVAAALPAIVTDPQHFSPDSPGAWKHLIPMLAVAALVGAALYLKQHPTPWDGTERRGNEEKS